MQPQGPYDDLVGQLQALRAHAGLPSFGDIATNVSRVRRERGATVEQARVGRTTVYDAFRMGRQRIDTSSADVLKSSGYFGFVEDRSFKQWQDVNRESILDMARSRSHIAVLDEEEREERLAAILAFYDDYGRGMDGMQLPYDCDCYRATVIKKPKAASPPPAFEPEPHRRLFSDEPEETQPLDRDDVPRKAEGAAEAGDGGNDGDDDDLLLIHFR